MSLCDKGFFFLFFFSHTGKTPPEFFEFEYKEDGLICWGKKVTGACECVSLVGPLLGGGYGYLQGFYGLISDNLISARLVLASGEAISVSATDNSGE